MDEQNEIQQLSRKFLELINDLKHGKCLYSLPYYKKSIIEKFYTTLIKNTEIQTIDDISKELIKSERNRVRYILKGLPEKNSLEAGWKSDNSINQAPISSIQEIEDMSIEFNYYQNHTHSSLDSINRLSLILSENCQEEIDLNLDTRKPMVFTEDLPCFQQLHDKIDKILEFKKRTLRLEKKNQEKFNQNNLAKNDLIAFSLMCSFNLIQYKIVELNKEIDEIDVYISRFTHIKYLNPLLIDQYFESKNETFLCKKDYSKVKEIVSKIEDLHDSIKDNIQKAEEQLSKEKVNGFSKTSIIRLNSGIMIQDSTRIFSQGRIRKKI
jgi:hypothetical protein